MSKWLCGWICVLGVAAALLVSGCTAADGESDAPALDAGGSDVSVEDVSSASSQLSGANTSLPFSTKSIQDQVASTFRRTDDGWHIDRVTYDVEAGADGFSMTGRHWPGREAAGSKTEPVSGSAVHFWTAEVRRTGKTARPSAIRRADKGHLEWQLGDTVERLESSADSVEQSWAFESAPAGSGDLVVEVGVRGQTFSETTDQGLHFVDPDTGLGTRYGHGTWIDARGRQFSLPARWMGDHIELRVPARVVDQAAYPAELDPTISPEFGTDQPVNAPRAEAQGECKVAFNGTDYLVVWGAKTGVSFDIRGARVATDGTVLDLQGITLTNSPANQTRPSVASDGTDFLVVWQDTRLPGDYNVYGTRVTSAGAVQDPSGFQISTNAAHQRDPSVAFDGTNYLVVWEDERNDATSDHDIYGTRVAPDATVLDTGGFAISTASDTQSWTDVAFNGSEYLVVWQDERGRLADIYGARVRPDGTVLDASGVQVGSANLGSWPAVASDGTDFLVVWDSSGVSAARVSWSGQVLDTPSFTIPDSFGSQSSPDVAFDGTNYMVVWSVWSSSLDTTNVHGTRVSPSGALLDSVPIAIEADSTQDSRPAIAFGDGDHLVVWNRYELQSATVRDVYAGVISAAGTRRASQDIALTEGANSQVEPAVAFDGTNYLLVWQDARSTSTEWDIWGVRIAPGGQVLDPTGIAISTADGNQQYPEVVFDGTNFMVVWQDARGGVNHNYDVYGARVARDGAVLDPSGIAITTSGRRQSRPDVAFNGTNHLVVWSDDRTGDYHIRGARVSPAGTLLDQYGLAIGTQNDFQYAPKVASNGADFLVAWEHRLYQNYEILAARVEADGTVADSPPLSLATSSAPVREIALASDDTNYIATWTQATPPQTDIRVRAARITPAGVILDSPAIDLGGSPTRFIDTAVAFNGTEYLVAWQDERGGEATSHDIWGVRLATDGSILGGGEFVLAQEVHGEFMPYLAGGRASQWMLTYATNETGSGRIYGRFVGMNLAPYGTSQAVVTSEEQSIDVTVSATDPEGEPLTFAIDTLPARGTLTGSAPQLTYTPQADFFGEDRFSVVANDGVHDSAPIEVVVTVENVNDPPSAVDDAAVTDEDVAVVIAVLQNDEDIDGDTLAVSVTTPPGHGQASADATGAITYTPQGDWSGTDTFTYEITDAGSVTDTASVTVTVDAVNDPPDAVDDLAATDEDTAVTVDVLTNDSDRENDALTVSSASGAQMGDVVVNADATITYTPHVDVSGSDSFTYEVSDPSGASSSATVEVEIAPINDAPEGTNDNATTQEDTSVIIDVLQNDSDIDQDPMSVAVTTQPSFGQALVQGDASIEYVPQANFHGSDTFTYEVSDASGASDSATVHVDVTSVNDVPQAVDDTATTLEETAVTVSVLQNDDDLDGDTLTVSIVTAPPSGQVSVNADDTITYTPDLNFVGTDSLVYRASDANGGTDEAALTITVTGVNDSPDVTDDTATTAEDTAVTIDVLQNDSDPDGDSLTVSLAGAQPSNGTAAVEPDQTIRYTPPADFAGQASFSYTATDPSGASASSTVTVTVSAVNDPPVAADDVATTDKATPVSIDVLANDDDVDGDSLSVSIETSAEHGETVVESDHSITYTPANDFEGSDTFSYAVDDGAGGSDIASVTVEVVNSNEAPGFVAPTPGDEEVLSVDEGSLLEFELAADDPNGDALTLTVDPLMSEASFDAGTGVFSWTPTWEDVGSYELDMMVSDGELSDERTILIEVVRVDADQDGLSDGWEREHGLDPQSDDSDADGIPDAVEAGDDTGEPIDTDEDQLPDAVDADSDADGALDSEEGEVDTDGDGTPDFRDIDSDRDGIADRDDNCRVIENADQLDTDDDGVGDACQTPDDSDDEDQPDDEPGLQDTQRGGDGCGCRSVDRPVPSGAPLGLAFGALLALSMAWRRHRRLAA